ncbi:MAG TPA: YciI family protein [Steroidobacteraceae bacterium]|nr:YciI family protein [Steroidobacteraceae bacterium]
MLYSILCYESEALASSRTQQEDDAMMVRLRAVQRQLKEEGKLGPVARLMPTTTATHIRSGKDPLVVDGPFAETKEQLLGFYVLDCASLEDAIAAAKLLAAQKPQGTLEIRPVAVFNPVGPSK